MVAVLRAVAVTGRSMRPALNPGDWLLMSGLRRVKPGRVVLVEHPQRPGFLMVKRVAAVEQDRVLVVSDDPEAGTDSRHFGPVPRGCVLGVLVVRYRRGPA